jgi:hypothetical protein
MLHHSKKIQINKAKQEKGYLCCVSPTPENDTIIDLSPNACGKSNGAPCGPIKDYGEDTSVCCGSEGEKSGVVVCDASKVGLSFHPCAASFSCREYSTFGWKRDDEDGDEDGGIYAVCERPQG